MPLTAKDEMKRGKHTAHTAPGGQRQFFFIHTQQSARLVADAAADLQRGTFSSGTAAAQVRDNGGNKNRRYQPKRNMGTEVHAANDVIGTFSFRFRQTVDGGTAYPLRRPQRRSARLPLPTCTVSAHTATNVWPAASLFLSISPQAHTALSLKLIISVLRFRCQFAHLCL